MPRVGCPTSSSLPLIFPHNLEMRGRCCAGVAQVAFPCLLRLKSFSKVTLRPVGAIDFGTFG